MKTSKIETLIFAILLILAATAIFHATKHSFKKCEQQAINSQQTRACLNI